MTNKLTLEDVIGFVGDDARPDDFRNRPFVLLPENDYGRLIESITDYHAFTVSNGFSFAPLDELIFGSMELLSTSEGRKPNRRLRRHEPGDPMPWREKLPLCHPDALPAQCTDMTIDDPIAPHRITEYEYKTVLYWTDGPGDDGQSEPTPAEADGWIKSLYPYPQPDKLHESIMGEMEKSGYKVTWLSYERPIPPSPQPPERVYEHCPSDTPLRGDWPKTGRPSGPVGRGNG
jgi:hypothetical protein